MVANDTPNRKRKRRSAPLDKGGLEQLAVAYVARFATSSAKLEAYLWRKLRERGYEDEESEEAAIQTLVQHYCDLGYVDDAAYARMKSEGLRARGYGPRRVDEALRAAGIDSDIRTRNAGSELQARDSALRLAKRRRFGPFGRPGDKAQSEKQIAAMVRAGHSFTAARAIVTAPDCESASDWVAEAEGID